MTEEQRGGEGGTWSERKRRSDEGSGERNEGSVDRRVQLTQTDKQAVSRALVSLWRGARVTQHGGQSIPIMIHTLQDGMRDQRWRWIKEFLTRCVYRIQTRRRSYRKIKRHDGRESITRGNKDTARDETPNALLSPDVIASNQPRLPPLHLPEFNQRSCVDTPFHRRSSVSHHALVCMTIKYWDATTLSDRVAPPALTFCFAG